MLSEHQKTPLQQKVQSPPQEVDVEAAPLTEIAQETASPVYEKKAMFLKSELFVPFQNPKLCGSIAGGLKVQLNQSRSIKPLLQVKL